MPYSQIKVGERHEIAALLEHDFGVRAIARHLGRNQSTVSREIARNGGESYEAADADRRAQKRATTANRGCWKVNTAMLRRIETGLLSDSPDGIAGRSRRMGEEMPSHERIYQLIYGNAIDGGVWWQRTRYRHKRRKHRSRRYDGRGRIPNRRGIEQRPADVDHRATTGDWEADLICGAGNRTALVTVVDRYGRYGLIRRIEDRSAERVADVIVDMLKGEPVTSLTVDNGKEFAGHERIARKLSTDVYFAEPYSSWQRGTNEQYNGIVRRFFPKGTDFSKVTDLEVAIVEHTINSRPRKLLKYATAWEVHSGRAHLPPGVAVQS
jgi:IS30 family transposase